AQSPSDFSKRFLGNFHLADFNLLIARCYNTASVSHRFLRSYRSCPDLRPPIGPASRPPTATLADDAPTASVFDALVARPWRWPAATRLAQLVEHCLRILEVGRVEAFGEPAVDRREQVMGFGTAALVAAELGEGDGGAQFPELGPLLLGDRQGLFIELRGGVGIALPQHQLAFVPVQLRREPVLPYPSSDLQGIVQQGQGLLDLVRDPAGLGQEGAMVG